MKDITCWPAIWLVTVAFGCVGGGSGGGDAAVDAGGQGGEDGGIDCILEGAERACEVAPDLAPGCMGVEACVGGELTACQAPAEICDGVDTDCDGVVDNGFDGLGEACAAGAGACVAEGVQVCNAAGDGVECGASPGAGSDEVCDGVDDDCDGRVDEGVEGMACQVGVGACAAPGLSTCVDGAAGCQGDPGAPGPEVCNGVDDDCNGVVDDGVPSVACDAGLGACRAAGETVCEAGAEVCGAVPGEPVFDDCDALDNDCDGEIDEGCPRCGDGRVDGPDEQCDDGNDIEGDGCDPACQLERPQDCGNGVVDAGERCDGGSSAVLDTLGNGALRSNSGTFIRAQTFTLGADTFVGTVDVLIRGNCADLPLAIGVMGAEPPQRGFLWEARLDADRPLVPQNTWSRTRVGQRFPAGEYALLIRQDQVPVGCLLIGSTDDPYLDGEAWSTVANGPGLRVLGPGNDFAIRLNSTAGAVPNDSCTALCQTVALRAFAGPERAVPQAGLEAGGFEVCYADRYDAVLDDAAMMAQCGGDVLLVGCRPAETDAFTVAAMGLRAEVFEAVPNEVEASHTHNGTQWYFGEAFSFGFAPEGQPISRAECDGANPVGTRRLCWHTGPIGGWRCGANSDVGAGWERVVMQRAGDVGGEVSATPIADTGGDVRFTGALEAGDRTWRRPSAACRAEGEDLHPYEVFRVVNTTGAEQIVHVEARWSGGEDGDGFLHVFTDAFAPAVVAIAEGSPIDACLLGDDDGDAARDNSELSVAVARGQTVVIVASSFYGDDGQFDRFIGGYTITVTTQAAP